MKMRVFGALLLSVTLAGCQTAPPKDSPEAKKQAEYNQVVLNGALANCKLVKLADAKRIQKKEKPSPHNRCDYVLKNNKVATGTFHPANIVPDISVNNIPIPVGGLVRLAVQLERKSREDKALKATVPNAIAGKGRGAEFTYRFMKVQEFSDPEILAISSTSEFSAAAAASEKYTRLAETDPDFLKHIQKQ